MSIYDDGRGGTHLTFLPEYNTCTLAPPLVTISFLLVYCYGKKSFLRVVLLADSAVSIFIYEQAKEQAL
jgi:hypothetical protein